MTGMWIASATCLKYSITGAGTVAAPKNGGMIITSPLPCLVLRGCAAVTWALVAGGDVTGAVRRPARERTGDASRSASVSENCSE
jgi:hypothetical protein